MANEVEIGKSGFVSFGIDIKPKNSSTMKSFLYKVDTGANRTTISLVLLKELGYGIDWVKSGKLLLGDERPTLATGEPVDDCYIITLPEIRIGDWVGYNWPLLTGLTVPFKLLLGTDSMQFFNWHLDYENNICKFDLIPNKRKLLFNKKEQSIHAVDEVN